MFVLSLIRPVLCALCCGRLQGHTVNKTIPTLHPHRACCPLGEQEMQHNECPGHTRHPVLKSTMFSVLSQASVQFSRPWGSCGQGPCRAGICCQFLGLERRSELVVKSLGVRTECRDAESEVGGWNLQQTQRKQVSPDGDSGRLWIAPVRGFCSQWMSVFHRVKARP